jgi:hypothetical protein
MIFSIIRDLFFVPKSLMGLVLTRYILMAMMLTIGMNGFTQSFFINIESNLPSYKNSPCQTQDVIAPQKVKRTQYCLAEAVQFNAFFGRFVEETYSNNRK